MAQDETEAVETRQCLVSTLNFNIRMDYETVIGLEVHVQLRTRTKMFCSCPTEFGSEPNSQTCPVCLGFPGSLPVLNENALEGAVKVGLALNCFVREFIKFDRKNYFYPDLPKNYQISQYDMPVALGGFIDVETDGAKKRVGVRRAHLEEDAGKLIHKEGANYSLVDYNRCGMPLLEIVSEPDINSPQEAFEYLKDLKLIIQYLDVSDCDMEKGTLRCDANISLRPKGQKELGVKTEVKNMNSFRAVKLALEYEIKRQKELLEEGKRIVQETRLWEETKQATFQMRSKEEAHDYRYFPEPDLAPFTLTKEFIEGLKKELPELPKEKILRFTEKFGLSQKEAQVIAQDKELCSFFEVCAGICSEYKIIYNWLAGPVLAYLNDRKKQLKDLKLEPKELIKLTQFVVESKISNLAAKEVLFAALDENKEVEVIIGERGLAQVSGEADLEKFIEAAIKENQKSVSDFLSGKENALMFLVGQAMKLSKGKANPKVVKGLLVRKLKSA